jgi:succinoglycan biosynthesis transport protein ExoP
MPDANADSQDSGMSLDDIYFVLFKHKWWILITSLIGIAAAATLYLTHTQMYQSNAKILVKYVADRGVDPAAGSQGSGGEMAAIGSELEILSSWDLAVKTAEALGTDRLGAKSISDASGTVLSGMTATAVRGTSVIGLSYKHTDPEIARVVLQEFVRQYLKMHFQIHTAKEAFQVAERQRDNVKSRLNSTEEDLKKQKEAANIFSIGESITALSGQINKVQTDLQAAMAERAEHKARLEELSKTFGATNSELAPERTTSAGTASSADVDRYQAIMARVNLLRRDQTELTARYKPEAAIVKLTESQLATADRQRRELEAKFPELAGRAQTTDSSQPGRIDMVTERAKLVSLDAKVGILGEQIKALEVEGKRLLGHALSISDLERDKEVTETTYRHLSERLEAAGFNQLLSPTILPNIGIVQEATPASKARSGLMKTLMALAGGGIGGGIGLAFAFEIFLNRTVKRPLELETRLGMPLLLSIPSVPKSLRSATRQLLAKGDSKAIVKSGPRSTAAAWESGHFMRPFADAIRDRLVLWFELTGLTRRPKLVAVTGMSPGSGVSTLSGGLAAALSDTGDGKVLLVNMNVGTADMQPFYEGKVSYPLKEALDDSPMEPASENLYLATVGSASSGPAQLIPKRFYDLIPHLKASDFDYIIFDMPPLSQSSATLAIAGFMDHVLFVVEAEKDNREDVKRGFRELVAAKAMVSGIFNKGRTYAPKWLGGSL